MIIKTNEVFKIVKNGIFRMYALHLEYPFQVAGCFPDYNFLCPLTHVTLGQRSREPRWLMRFRFHCTALPQVVKPITIAQCAEQQNVWNYQVRAPSTREECGTHRPAEQHHSYGIVILTLHITLFGWLTHKGRCERHVACTRETRNA